METIKVTVDGMDFSIQQFRFDEAIELETITLSLFAPIIDMLEGFKGLDEEIEMGGLGTSIQKILFSLRKENPFDYIQKMIRNTFYNNGRQEINLNNRDDINKIFIGKTLTCMKLLIEVMKVNKFAFIEGLAGKGVGLIDTFMGAKLEKQKRNEVSEK